MFVTAQGSALTRFRRALDNGNLVEALSSASEMEHVGLVESLELCLLLVKKEPAKYERAALRWHAKYCAEARGVSATEAQAVLSLLVLLPGEGGPASAAALAHLIGAHRGQERATEALLRWVEARAG